jgi:hypothetical protein
MVRLWDEGRILSWVADNRFKSECREAVEIIEELMPEDGEPLPEPMDKRLDEVRRLISRSESYAMDAQSSAEEADDLLSKIIDG